MHFSKYLALVLLTAVTLCEGVSPGVSDAASHARLFLETKCPLGGADEESRGPVSPTPALRAEFTSESQARLTLRRLRARHLNLSPLSSGLFRTGTTELGALTPDPVNIQSALLRAMVLRV